MSAEACTAFGAVSVSFQLSDYDGIENLLTKSFKSFSNGREETALKNVAGWILGQVKLVETCM
jgi:hypothetical protein